MTSFMKCLCLRAHVYTTGILSKLRTFSYSSSSLLCVCRYMMVNVLLSLLVLELVTCPIVQFRNWFDVTNWKCAVRWLA